MTSELHKKAIARITPKQRQKTIAQLKALTHAKDKGWYLGITYLKFLRYRGYKSYHQRLQQVLKNRNNPFMMIALSK